jgi:hypothetical protein
MKTVIVKYQKLPKPEISYLKSIKPQINQVTQIITDECAVMCENKIIAIYKKADFNTLKLFKTCNSLSFQSSQRSTGLVSTTISINSHPRKPFHLHKCSASDLRFKQPKRHQIFIDHARLISKSYKNYFRTPFVNQIKRNFIGAHKVHPFYRIKGTPFSGGVINKNCALNYHFDRANTNDGISCMIILKENTLGGELILPELNIGFSCDDGYILLFDGQKYLHGVTEMLSSSNGYRYTIVYYNNNGMNLCLPPDEEEKHFQNWLDKK